MFLIGNGREETKKGFIEEVAFKLSLTGNMEFGSLEKKDCGSDMWKGKQGGYSRERQEHTQQTNPAGGQKGLN